MQWQGAPEAASFRLFLMGALLAFLAGPTLVQEERRYHKDVAVVVTDRSLSQDVGDRTDQTDRVLEKIRSGTDGLMALKSVTSKRAREPAGPPMAPC